MTAASPGAGLFLAAECDHALAGFASIGRPGKPSEHFAEEVVEAHLAHRDSHPAVDAHLGDHLILPAALALGTTRLSVARITRHMLTNAWVVELFGIAQVVIEGLEGSPGAIQIVPHH